MKVEDAVGGIGIFAAAVGVLLRGQTSRIMHVAIPMKAAVVAGLSEEQLQLALFVCKRFGMVELIQDKLCITQQGSSFFEKEAVGFIEHCGESGVVELLQRMNAHAG